MTAIAALLVTIGETLVIVSLLAWIVYDFLKLAGDIKGADAFGQYIFNFISSALGIAVKFLAAGEAQLAPIVNAFRTAVNNQKGPLSSAIDADIRGMIINAFNAVEKAVTLGKTSEPADAVKTGAAAMSEAFAFGMESFAVSAAFEALFPEKLNVLNGVGPMLSQLAGFDEVGKALREPLYRNAFGRSAEYYYRSVFKPELPDEADAVTWNSRRLLKPGQLQNIFDNSGLKTEYEQAFINSAFRAVQPRALATLFQDVQVPVAALKDALQFAGIRDQEIALMLPAFQWNAVKNVRNEYISAAVRSTELGTMTPAELDQELQVLKYSQEARDLIQLTVATRKLEQLAQLYRKSISEAYRTGQITDAQYVPSLEAIGIGAADAQAHYAVDSIAKTGKALAQALRAEERLASQRMRAAVAAAVASYKSGFFDSTALEAALLATGLDPVVAALSVEVQTQRRDGNVVFVYGVELPRAAAVELREKVAALAIQVRARLVTPDDALTALAGYGVPRANALALVAEWAATTVTPARVGVLEPR